MDSWTKDAMPIVASPKLHRRGFLTGAAALGFTAGMAGDRVFDPAALQALSKGVGSPNWNNLAKELAGPLLRPHNQPYDRFAAFYNLAYARRRRKPAAIALCASTADVKTAIDWARDNNVPLVARGGGHSYGGYSTTPGLMIDVTTIRGSYWSKPDEVTFGAGNRNANLYTVLKAANRTVTHGRCPTVGASGFLLGGGIGFNMRLHGVASDQMTASEIVTANGDILQLSETENADLFWACRGGGGGNFGINTSFTLKTFPTQKITFFRASWSGTRKDMANVATVLMKSLTGAPNTLGSRFALTAPNRIGQDKHFGVNVIGQYQSDDDMSKMVEDLLAPALQAVKSCQRVDEWPAHAGACTYQILFVDYWTAQLKYLLDNDPPFAFHERSAYLTEPLTGDDFDQASKIMEQWHGSDDRGGPPINSDFRFFQTGGAINDVPADKTAFVHRNNVWLADIGLSWSGHDSPARIEANVRWQDKFYDELLSFKACNRQAYQNFIDPQLKDYAQAYYGGNLDRLSRIKGKVDPKDLFRFPQQIPASPP
jgi:hypothetical protein